MNGWNPSLNVQAYMIYRAYQTNAGAYTFGVFANVSPNSSITDEFQVSRHSTTNTWRIYWNGNLSITPNLGFWSGDCLNMGGEYQDYDYSGHANTFNMYGKAINAAGVRVNWANQGGNFIPLYPGGNMNGVTYSNSQWSWNTFN